MHAAEQASAGSAKLHLKCELVQGSSDQQASPEWLEHISRFEPVHDMHVPTLLNVTLRMT